MNKLWTMTSLVSAFVILFLILAVIPSAAAVTGHAIYLNESQIMYLFSTSSQVIAAIYGLTLTAFVFFRNELSREESEDGTLTEAFDNLKARYFVFLLFITALVIVTLLLGNLAISYEGLGDRSLNTIIINSGQAAFLTSLSATAYFVFDVMSPNRLASASKTIQSKVDQGTGRAGSLRDFLKNYNGIESLLEKSNLAYKQTSISMDEGNYRRRIPNSRLAEGLHQTQRIDDDLFQNLRSLIALRNSIIHGADPVVSQSMVDSSAQVLRQLKLALERDDGAV